jgi:hypothetical protein
MLCEGTECHVLCLELYSDGCTTAVLFLHAEYKHVKQNSIIVSSLLFPVTVGLYLFTAP